jgi:hypothetical protein
MTSERSHHRLGAPSIALASVLVAFFAAAAQATAVHPYKKNEYPVITDGTAPSRKLSIAAHGGGELGDEGFHLYLMAEPTHTIIRRLPGVGGDNILDTAPDAFQARWSTDSQHVAVLFRFDRHILGMELYAIRDGRAQAVGGPILIDQVAGKATAQDYRLGSSVTTFSWLSATRFALTERDVLSSDSPALKSKIGAFGRPLPGETPAADPDGSYFLDFSAEAVGELIAGNRYRITDLKPGRFDE